MNSQRTNPIREAIASGEFHRALFLWNEFTAQIRDEIGRGICTQDSITETAELMTWSRGVVLCERAHLQSQLTTMWVASQYGPAEWGTPSCLRTNL
jgi:hypothetical protein